VSVEIDPQKLTYLLQRDPGKAKFFGSYGFDPARPLELDAALRLHPVLNPYDSWHKTVHGIKIVIKCTLPTPDHRNPCVKTVWIIDAGQTMPRFVTGYASPP
jgi:hypothetical protein